VPKHPEIITERLLLRETLLSDRDDFSRLMGDPEVMTYVAPEALGKAESWSKLLMKVATWHLLGLGNWIVCDKESGAFIGEISFFDAIRDLTPDLGDAYEAGWAFLPEFWGRGIASEAALAAHAWYDSAGISHPTFCIINEKNAASIKVAQKCGYALHRAYNDGRGRQHIMLRNRTE